MFCSLRFGSVWFGFVLGFGFSFGFGLVSVFSFGFGGLASSSATATAMASVVPDASSMLTPMPSSASPSGHAPFSVFSFFYHFCNCFLCSILCCCCCCSPECLFIFFCSKNSRRDLQFNCAARSKQEAGAGATPQNQLSNGQIFGQSFVYAASNFDLSTVAFRCCCCCFCCWH